MRKEEVWCFALCEQQATVNSPVLAQVRKQADERQKTKSSFASLVPSTDSFSLDSVSINETPEGSSSASASVGSPSLNAVRLEPEGSSGAGSQHTPEQEPTYADIETVAEVALAHIDQGEALRTPQGRLPQPAAAPAASPMLGKRVKMGSGTLTLPRSQKGVSSARSPQLERSVSFTGSPLLAKPHSLSISSSKSPQEHGLSPLASQPVEDIYTTVDQEDNDLPDMADLPPPPPMEDFDLPPPPPLDDVDDATPATRTIGKAPPPTKPKSVKSIGSLSSVEYDYVDVPSASGNPVTGALDAPGEYATPRYNDAATMRATSVCQYEDSPEQMVGPPPGRPPYAHVTKASTTTMMKDLRRRTESEAGTSPADSSQSPRTKARLPTPMKNRGQSSNKMPRTMTMDV